MFTFAIKAAGDKSPLFASVLLLGCLYALGIAPQFTDDAYLKILSVFLVPVIAIGSSPSTGFMMNTEVLMICGLLTALLIKVITMNEKAKEALKRSTEPANRLLAILLYSSIFIFFCAMFILIPAVTGIQRHVDPSMHTPLYYFLIFLYIIALLASITGFNLGFKGGKSKSNNVPVAPVAPLVPASSLVPLAPKKA